MRPDAMIWRTSFGVITQALPSVRSQVGWWSSAPASRAFSAAL